MREFICIVSDPQKFGRGHLSRQKQIQAEFSGLGIDYPIYFELSSISVGKGCTLILDLSDQDDEPSVNFIEQFDEIIGFDWSGSLIPDWNYVVLEHPEKIYQAKKSVITGLNNLIVSPKISSLRKTPPSFSKHFLLISLGYSAASSAYRRALATRQSWGDLLIVLASGRHLDFNSTESLHVVYNSPNFLEIIAAATCVISNGGTTFVESLLMGKAVLPMPQSSSEEFFVDALLPLTDEDFSLPSFRKLNFERALKVGVDTKGAERLCTMILANK
jgi:hypothetical protein